MKKILLYLTQVLKLRLLRFATIRIRKKSESQIELSFICFNIKSLAVVLYRLNKFTKHRVIS